MNYFLKIFLFWLLLLLASGSVFSKTIHHTIHPITIIVDPGHGGKDSGALGTQGTTEKSIVLAVSKELANLINHQKNMRATLTRSKDEFVSLKDRLHLAYNGNADLLISIHADAFLDNHSTGASVYTLSKKGATTVAARWLATRQNHAVLSGVHLDKLNNQYPNLRYILINLSQTATTTNSLRLALALLSSFNKMLTVHTTHVEQAPFLVLKSLDTPSVLVEIGFISNPAEEAKLRDKQYQIKIAQAIFRGIQHYETDYGIFAYRKINTSTRQSNLSR